MDRSSGSCYTLGPEDCGEEPVASDFDSSRGHVVAGGRLGSPSGPERSRSRGRSCFRLQRPGAEGKSADHDNKAGRGPVREWADLPEWITTEEAADLSGYDAQHVRRLARLGRIGTVKKGHDWWVDHDVFRAYLEAMNTLGNKRHDPRGPWNPQIETGPTAGRRS
jgi:hypothetical protein